MGAESLAQRGSTGSATRAEALAVFLAGVASAAVSRAGADGGDGLGVVDDLLADCPSVSLRVGGGGCDDQSLTAGHNSVLCCDVL